MASSMGKILGKMQVSSSFGVIDPKKLSDTPIIPHLYHGQELDSIEFHRDFPRDSHIGMPY
jgi:hypothetical protein